MRCRESGQNCLAFLLSFNRAPPCLVQALLSRPFSLPTSHVATTPYIVMLCLGFCTISNLVCLEKTPDTYVVCLFAMVQPRMDDIMAQSATRGISYVIVLSILRKCCRTASKQIIFRDSSSMHVLVYVIDKRMSRRL